MTAHDAPPTEFAGLPAGGLRAAAMTWLERAARMAVDDDVMFQGSELYDRDASDEARELRVIDDRLSQHRNVAEARLCVEIARGLIEAAVSIPKINDDLIHRYSGASPEPLG